MGKILVCFAFLAAWSLAPSAGHADELVPGYQLPCTPFEVILTGTCKGWYPEIPDSPLCSDIAAKWVAAAKEAESSGCYLEGYMWSTDSRTQGEYCLSVGDLDIASRTSDMRHQIAICRYCSHVANLMTDAAKVNDKLHCGYGGRGAPDNRWVPDRKFHYNTCYLNFPAWSQMAALPAYVQDTVDGAKKCLMTPVKEVSKDISNSTIQGHQLRLNPKDVLVDPCKSDPKFKCKQPSSKLIGPGLLEGDQDFIRQGPSATGSPVGAGANRGR